MSVSMPNSSSYGAGSSSGGGSGGGSGYVTSSNTLPLIFSQNSPTIGIVECPGGHFVLNDPEIARFIDGRMVFYCSVCNCRVEMEEMPTGGLWARAQQVIELLMAGGVDAHALESLADVVRRYETMLDEAKNIENAIQLALEIVRQKS